jgi:hypothetical protein
LKRLNVSAETLELIRRQFLATLVGGQGKAQVPIGSIFGAHLRGQIDWQRANDGVASLNLRRIKMGYLDVDLELLAVSPFDGSGVAGDEKGGHYQRLNQGLASDKLRRSFPLQAHAVTFNLVAQSRGQAAGIAEVNPPRQGAFFQIGTQMGQGNVVCGSHTPQGDVKVRVGLGIDAVLPAGYA